jgi:glycosyltransferase involved in cell wall biosynthesis
MNSNARLRILQVGKYYPPYMGGMETHLQALCNELQQVAGVEVVVANSKKATEREIVEGVSVTRAGTLFNFKSAPVCPDLTRLIRQSDADIIHMHLPNPTAILAYLRSGHKGRLIFTYHSDTVRQKVLGKVFEPIQRRAFDRCAAVICTSPNYLNTSTWLGQYQCKCHVIPYGIALDEFARADTDAVMRIRQEHGERIVISVGRLIYYKGFEYLIRAMRKVEGRLLIIGDGPLRSALEREAQACEVQHKVIFLGEIQNRETITYYHAADVFALASVARSEAFGIVQIEAMACGKPVVNTNLDSGVPFVSLHNKTGITVPPEDPDALAAALNELLDNEALREKYGEAARWRAQEEFNLDKMVQRTLGLYDQVMSAPRLSQKRALV